MLAVPDAPWIREAERKGIPPYDEPDLTCPCCGAGCDEFVIDEDHAVIGCDKCTRRMNVWDWFYKFGKGAEP